MNTEQCFPIYGEPFETYRASGCVGAHALGDFASSPLLYAMRHLWKNPDAQEPDSKAFAFGRLFHCRTLETDQTMKRYHVVDDGMDRRTKAGKAAWAAIESTGLVPVSKEDMALSGEMAWAATRKKAFKQLLTAGGPEAVFRAELPAPSTGSGPRVRVQCRCDWFNPTRDKWQRPTIVELKSVERLADFPRQVERFHYYRNAAFYQLVVAAALGLSGAWPRVVLVACEKSAPWDCGIYELGEATQELGRQECGRLLRALAACQAGGEWPGEPDEVQTIELPEWRLARGDAA